ncbi:MAG: DNA replication/repair protein RecF [Firmicutes bacterium]|nr:DNA replication/repair protein RecF [Bacillota bacterium]
MYIKSTKIKDFRNYEILDLKFNEKVNIILGNNAQGKTNLLESIYIASIGRSFRTSKEGEMIRFGQDSAKVEMVFSKYTGDTEIEIQFFNNRKKSIKMDGVNLKKISQLLDNIYIVIFSPDDLKIVKDEPEKRRKFIDRELCLIRPSYYKDLLDYKKVLNERNTYLKENYIDRSMLDIWDAQLAKYGASIISKRREFIRELSDISGEIHRSITNNSENLRLVYKPNVEDENKLYEILKESDEQDIRMRTTTKGPHKDDMDFFIKRDGEEINARSFGSQGQQRTSALSLKLAEIRIIKDETGEDPILLLDDVMSELDLERQKYLIKTLSYNQLFISAAEMQESFIKEFPGAEVFYVSKGKVSKK